MDQQPVGYQLFAVGGTEVLASYGGICGQDIALPNPLILPNGDQVNGLNDVGVFGEYELRRWLMDRPKPTSDEVNAERDRRIAHGFKLNGHLFDNRPDDQINIAGASLKAFMAIVGGAQPGNYRWHGGTSDFIWIDHDNNLIPTDAQGVVAIGNASAAWKEAHIMVGRALKDMSPVPADYADDKYWPANV